MGHGIRAGVNRICRKEVRLEMISEGKKPGRNIKKGGEWYARTWEKYVARRRGLRPPGPRAPGHGPQAPSPKLRAPGRPRILPPSVLVAFPLSMLLSNYRPSLKCNERGR